MRFLPVVYQAAHPAVRLIVLKLNSPSACRSHFSSVVAHPHGAPSGRFLVEHLRTFAPPVRKEPMYNALVVHIGGNPLREGRM
jgi:hypothetical protein